MSWYYNRASGQVFEATGARKAVNDFEVKRQELIANIVPQWFFGPFATQAEADTFKAANPSWAAEVRSLNPVTNVQDAITQFTSTLAKLWVRAAEATVGIVLLAIAANAIIKQTTGVSPAGEVAKAGKAAGKTAATAAVA